MPRIIDKLGNGVVMSVSTPPCKHWSVTVGDEKRRPDPEDGRPFLFCPSTIPAIHGSIDPTPDSAVERNCFLINAGGVASVSTLAFISACDLSSSVCCAGVGLGISFGDTWPQPASAAESTKAVNAWRIEMNSWAGLKSLKHRQPVSRNARYRR